MLVIKIDRGNAEALQAGLACGFHIIGAAIDADERAVGLAHAAEFRGDDDFVATPLNGFADELFVAAAAIDIGRVEKGDAEIDGPAQGSDGLRVMAAA